MKSMFLETIKEKSIQKRFKEILEKPIKRKFIDFGIAKYNDLIQFGIIICLEKPDKEAIEWGYEYECYHAHIFIDLFFWCIEITFMDYN